MYVYRHIHYILILHMYIAYLYITYIHIYIRVFKGSLIVTFNSLIMTFDERKKVCQTKHKCQYEDTTYFQQLDFKIEVVPCCCSMECDEERKKV